MPLHVAVASTRPAKVEGAREALAAIAVVAPAYAACVVSAHDVGDVAPVMPMSEAATIQGARLRARTLFGRVTPATQTTIALGLEGGLDRLDGPAGPVWVLRSWACAFDGCLESVGAGPTIVVPSAVMREVEAGRELGDVIDARAGVGTRSHRGAWGVLTADVIGRREAFRLAVVAALAPFYNPEPYTPLSLP
jgi:inosine/xanthosine triphosphatase